MARKRVAPSSDGTAVDNPAGDSPATSNGEERPQPFHKVRMRNITAAIWQNRGERGPWYSVTCSRSYRDDNGNWHTAESFAGPDLLILAEVARAAFAWIVTVTQQANSQPVVSNPVGTSSGVTDDSIPF